MLDFDAGEYAAFVWPSYLLTALVFAGLIVSTLAYARAWRRKAEQRKPK